MVYSKIYAAFDSVAVFKPCYSRQNRRQKHDTNVRRNKSLSSAVPVHRQPTRPLPSSMCPPGGCTEVPSRCCRWRQPLTSNECAAISVTEVSTRLGGALPRGHLARTSEPWLHRRFPLPPPDPVRLRCSADTCRFYCEKSCQPLSQCVHTPSQFCYTHPSKSCRSQHYPPARTEAREYSQDFEKKPLPLGIEPTTCPLEGHEDGKASNKLAAR